MKFSFLGSIFGLQILLALSTVWAADDDKDMKDVDDPDFKQEMDSVSRKLLDGETLTGKEERVLDKVIDLFVGPDDGNEIDNPDQNSRTSEDDDKKKIDEDDAMDLDEADEGEGIPDDFEELSDDEDLDDFEVDIKVKDELKAKEFF